LQHFNNKNISHALNGENKIIAGAKVDGYDEKSLLFLLTSTGVSFLWFYGMYCYIS